MSKMFSFLFQTFHFFVIDGFILTVKIPASDFQGAHVQVQIQNVLQKARK